MLCTHARTMQTPRSGRWYRTASAIWSTERLRTSLAKVRFTTPLVAREGLIDRLSVVRCCCTAFEPDHDSGGARGARRALGVDRWSGFSRGARICSIRCGTRLSRTGGSSTESTILAVTSTTTRLLSFDERPTAVASSRCALALSRSTPPPPHHMCMFIFARRLLYGTRRTASGSLRHYQLPCNTPNYPQRTGGGSTGATEGWDATSRFKCHRTRTYTHYSCHNPTCRAIAGSRTRCPPTTHDRGGGQKDVDASSFASRRHRYPRSSRVFVSIAVVCTRGPRDRPHAIESRTSAAR
jgi:hypothetical protein